MCKWCEQYGADGGKWFLNPANYARRLYRVRREEVPGAEPTKAPGGQGGSSMGGAYMDEIIATRDTDPVAWKQWLARGEEVDQSSHFGQIVTLEETLQILDMAYPIAKMTCNCRRCGRGLEDDDNFTCIGIGPGMYKWERWPAAYQGGVEFLDPDQSKEYLRFLDKRGLVHTIETFGTPYIGGLCQCDLPDCGLLRIRLEYGKQMLFKGHNVALIDYEKCNGCSACIKRCQFTAMRMEPTMDKANVDLFKCFGCGLCATGCPVDAIQMIDRTKLPALANVW
ncbi:MAG: 4Fe-4S dicluster domain-containing protein [Chloroflexota bacterium]|nr:MAG: 4Fe-4S dicluster domain-containing protein [Chloroflexota bacterium]